MCVLACEQVQAFCLHDVAYKHLTLGTVYSAMHGIVGRA